MHVRIAHDEPVPRFRSCALALVLKEELMFGRRRDRISLTQHDLWYSILIASVFVVKYKR